MVNGKIQTYCDNCKTDVGRFKYLKRVNGNKYCKECYKELKKNHRKETIETFGIKKELSRLKLKATIESSGGIEKYNEYRRKRYEKKIGRTPRAYNRYSDEPKIKHSKIDSKKPKSNSYLTMQEKQNWFRILVKERGLDAEEAKERISSLVSQLNFVRKKMSETNKSEEDIKIKQAKLIEELWNS